jgi:NAD(P)-dependent dehydrogenase (short-subunit alcohol dehydrogenase family)
VLLTGAGGAVGRAAAAAFSGAGAKVVGVDHDKDALVEQIATGALADGQAGDLTDAEFLRQVVADQPAVDVLVNNVCAGTASALADTGDELLDHMLDVNLRTAFRLCRAYVPGMAKRRRGKVITLSSVLAGAVPAVSAYAAAKAALTGFTKSIALEYAGAGVQCNVLAPGYQAAGRAGPRDALNGPLLFLASGMSDHVTGQVLVVDGGYGIR